MRTHHPAFFESSHHKGPATLCEVSYSGARLEVAGELPAIGEPVQVYVWPANQAEPVELAGRVVGQRKDGFALEFAETGQELCQWIDALQAALAAGAPPAERGATGR
jgi:hypothetical protein